MAAQQKILIVDDDVNMAEIISLHLSKEDYEIRIVYDGEEALVVYDVFAPDLIVLDLMLPGINGYQVCREIRKRSMVPILMISSQGESHDKISGLKFGADDFIEKPFDIRELVARVQAILRRANAMRNMHAEFDIKCVKYPDLVINMSDYSVKYFGQSVEMPPMELELLYYLASSPNQVFSREQLLKEVWGYAFSANSRTVDVHIKRIRDKIPDHKLWEISTVWGKGYKFGVRTT